LSRKFTRVRARQSRTNLHSAIARRLVAVLCPFLDCYIANPGWSGFT
jgi:hypothetical protein